MVWRLPAASWSQASPGLRKTNEVPARCRYDVAAFLGMMHTACSWLCCTWLLLRSCLLGLLADPGAPGSFLLLAAWLLLAAPAVLHIWLALRIESARFQDFPSPGLPGPQETMLPICAFLINRCGRRMPRPALAVPSPEGAEEL